MTLGKRLMSLALLVLALLGLWTHGTHLLEHGKHAVDALRANNLAAVPKEISEFGPALGVGILNHLLDTYHHVMSAAHHAQADFLAFLAEHGSLKVAVGCGLGLVWVGAFAFFGVAWWPLVKAATWAGKIGWTAAFVLLFGFCLDLSDRWRNWKPKAPGAP